MAKTLHCIALSAAVSACVAANLGIFCKCQVNRCAGMACSDAKVPAHRPFSPLDSVGAIKENN
jgi:hypothetical protein